MAFKINADKFAYSASPEKVSESYAAELAKKLVADEAEERIAGYAALENKIEIAAAEEAALRREADRVLDERISLEASKLEGETALRSGADRELDERISLEASKLEDEAALRSDADRELDEKISREVSARIEADNLLREEIPSKVSQLENDNGYLTEHQDISGKADKDHTHSSDDITIGGNTLTDELLDLRGDLWFLDYGKADRPEIQEDFSTTTLNYFVKAWNNHEQRYGELASLSCIFEDGEYDSDYIASLTFDSGVTPTAIDYTDSGIINWVGTDCANVNSLSIFQPSANTHYDIVFYFNGTQFIGLVNGFVPATGNEAV